MRFWSLHKNVFFPKLEKINFEASKTETNVKTFKKLKKFFNMSQQIIALFLIQNFFL